MDLKARTVRVQGRRKGKGQDLRSRPAPPRRREAALRLATIPPSAPGLGFEMLSSSTWSSPRPNSSHRKSGMQQSRTTLMTLGTVRTRSGGLSR